jgi:hypothetical protein
MLFRFPEPPLYLKHEYELKQEPLELRLATHISACNKLRKDTSRNDIFSILVANYIRANRAKIQSAANTGTVYVVNQFKKPEEIDALRRIYGEALLVISCHAPFEKRLETLSNKFVAEHSDPTNRDKWRSEAEKLISKDEKEAEAYGQNVSSAFPLADCIVDTTSEDRTLNGINRLFRLVFGDPHLSPTYEEYGSNIAAPLCQGSCRLDFKVNENQRWAMNGKDHDVSGRTEGGDYREDASAA